MPRPVSTGGNWTVTPIWRPYWPQKGLDELGFVEEDAEEDGEGAGEDGEGA